MQASPIRLRGFGSSSRDLRKCLAARFGSYGQYEPVTKLGRPLAFKMHLPKCLGYFEVLTSTPWGMAPPCGAPRTLEG